MLSPDNELQLPYFSQNYNRYSYVLNNPLKYTDPDGEFIVPILIGAAIGVVSNGINNVIHHRSFFDGAGKAAIFGAIGGAVSHGIGEFANYALKKGFEKVGVGIFQGLAHSWTGAVFSMAQGSNPLAGYLSGGLSSGVSSGLGTLGTGREVLYISGGLSGGIGSAIGGGNFWDGVGQGLVTAGLNHAAHSIFTDPTKLLFFDGKKIYIIEDGKIVASFPAVSGRPLEDGSFDYSEERQAIHDVGPIPEGDYSVNMNTTQKWSDLGFLQKSYALADRGRFPGGTPAWGSERVDLTPIGANPFEVRVRSGFTIHGGSNAGSAGCIDLTTYDKSFFGRIRNTGTWNLTVKY